MFLDVYLKHLGPTCFCHVLVSCLCRSLCICLHVPLFCWPDGRLSLSNGQSSCL